MPYEFNAVFEKKGDVFISYVEDIPGVNLQSQTLEEARQDLKEAIELVSAAARKLADRNVLNVPPGHTSAEPTGKRSAETDLKKHLIRQGCVLHRKGKKYSVYIHPHSGKMSTVPHLRHIEKSLAQRICSDLGISKSIEL